MSHQNTETGNFFEAAKGIKSWLYTLDHKRIGLMYLIFVIISFALGGFFALILRLELLTPETLFFTPKQYNQAFTMHGAIMVFLFIIPSIPDFSPSTTPSSQFHSYYVPDSLPNNILLLLFKPFSSSIQIKIK